MSNDSGLSNNDSRRFGKGNAAGSAEEGTLQVGARNKASVVVLGEE